MVCGFVVAIASCGGKKEGGETAKDSVSAPVQDTAAAAVDTTKHDTTAVK